MTLSEKAFDVVDIVAFRKSMFYRESRNRLLKQLPVRIDQEKAKKVLREAISSLEDELFIGAEEKKLGIIDPSTPIGELGIDRSRIVEEVVKKISGE